jgi:formate hydrogenlyase subunit 6/NADH:ubiquinone oxidoreductase subunit I
MRRNASYINNITGTLSSLWSGLRITFKHLVKARTTQPIRAIGESNYFESREGIATIQYPYEMQPVPDNGRYRLHNEIDDCIVCDKCAKICPVNCIDIEPIRATEEIGKTSDGTPKRIYAATFDIDMGKCCFCGLCTTVCPTECLTMTKVFDFSVTDIHEHNFAFAEMSEADIADKRKKLEEHQKTKLASQPSKPEAGDKKPVAGTPLPAAKPVFKPKIKPPGSSAPPTPPATT